MSAWLKWMHRVEIEDEEAGLRRMNQTTLECWNQDNDSDAFLFESGVRYVQILATPHAN